MDGVKGVIRFSLFLNLPQLGCVVHAGSNQEGAIGTESNIGQILCMGGYRLQFFAGFSIPHRKFIGARCGQEPSVRTESKLRNPVLVPFEGADKFSGRNLPQGCFGPSCFPLPSREILSIRAENRGDYSLFVPLKHSVFHQAFAPIRASLFSTT